jgi:D-alanine-D-alanine ligase
MKKAKLRIGVLMGGRSIEREVSFNSGRTICDHLDSTLYDVIPLFQTEAGSLYILPWHFLHRGKISDFAHRLAGEATPLVWDDLPNHIDFMYLSLHGRYGEDGSIQGILEVLNIPYLGSKVTASALSMDKALQQHIITAHGYQTPTTITLQPHEIKTITTLDLEQQLASKHLSFPLIIKPAQEGSSLGVAVVEQMDRLIPALQQACTVSPGHLQPVLIQEKIKGMEFVCIGIQEEDASWKALPLTEVCLEDGTAFYDYEQKYMPGRATKITPARCNDTITIAIQQACIHLFDVFNFATIARIDGFVCEDGSIIILDTNTLPGTAPATFLFHQAAEIGLSHTMLINLLIQRELKRYNMLEPTSREVRMNNNYEKKRIAVLFGGNANEREISLETGRNVCYKLSPKKYTVIPLFVDNNMHLHHVSERLLLQNSTREIADQLNATTQIQWSDLPSICDFVFIGLHGGAGENGSVQGVLEMLHLPYNGSGVLTSALAMDKAQTNTLLHYHGIDVPRHELLALNDWQQLSDSEKKDYGHTIVTTLSLPIIVKPHNDGCSIMVSKVTHVDDLPAAIENIFARNKDYALLEEYIEGMELTCGVIGNETVTVLPPSQAFSSGSILSIEEKFLPGQGENQTPAPLDAKTTTFVQATMKRVYEILGCSGYCRIDCFYQTAEQSPTKQPRIVIIECNSLPGLTPATCIFHQAAEIGLKPMEFIDKIVQFGFERHQKNITPTSEKIYSSKNA